MAEPANGYLWDLAQRRGITFRNYGEFVIRVRRGGPGRAAVRVPGEPSRSSRRTPTRPSPATTWTSPTSTAPTSGSRSSRSSCGGGRCRRSRSCAFPTTTPRARGRGRPRRARTWPTTTWRWGGWSRRSRARRFWRSTAIFVLEDDAQNGPDHVDSHRSPLLVISPWARPGVHPPLRQHHRRARHHRGDPRAGLAVAVRLLRPAAARHLAQRPDAAPYTALRPEVPLDERNVAGARGARSRKTSTWRSRIEFPMTSSTGFSGGRSRGRGWRIPSRNSCRRLSGRGSRPGLANGVSCGA